MRYLRAKIFTSNHLSILLLGISAPPFQHTCPNSFLPIWPDPKTPYHFTNLSPNQRNLEVNNPHCCHGVSKGLPTLPKPSVAIIPPSSSPMVSTLPSSLLSTPVSNPSPYPLKRAIPPLLAAFNPSIQPLSASIPPLLYTQALPSIPFSTSLHRLPQVTYHQRRFYSAVATESTEDMDFLAGEKLKHTPPTNLGTKYKLDEVHRFMVDCMTSVGTPKTPASALADVLIAADNRGHFSHGLNRLEMYVNDVRKKICDGGADPTILKESVSTALVDGHNGLGPVIGNFCVDLAIKKAKETGIGWVCARGSNHYGIAGWYAMRATQAGLMGMSFTNTSPLVAPTRAKKAALGTNPIALSAPAKGDDSFVLDMATCVVAVGKIEIERRKEKPIPEGWALDKDGKSTTNATEAMVGALMPLGGPETHSGYKGYGLGMLVEIFCGIMSGAHYGPNVRRWMETDRPADLGQCFVAIDPSFFAPGFEDRMGDLMDHCRNMEPSEPEKPVLAAGDPERAHIEKVKEEGGITYLINQVTDSWCLAQVLGVTPLQSM